MAIATYSEKSLAILETSNFQLVRIFMKVIEIIDCTILCGHRDKVQQNSLYRSGHSQLIWARSKHNKMPSEAIDAAPCPIDWSNLKRFYYFAGIVQGIAHMQKTPIRWGGDWDRDNDLDDQSFNDFCHFELVKEA